MCWALNLYLGILFAVCVTICWIHNVFNIVAPVSMTVRTNHQKIINNQHQSSTRIEGNSQHFWSGFSGGPDEKTQTSKWADEYKPRFARLLQPTPGPLESGNWCMFIPDLNEADWGKKVQILSRPIVLLLVCFGLQFDNCETASQNWMGTDVTRWHLCWFTVVHVKEA